MSTRFRSTTGRSPLVPVASLALAVLLAACGGGSAATTGGGSGSSASGGSGASGVPAADSSASPAAPSEAPSRDPDVIDHPTGATDVVLRVGEEGGFMMMEAVMSRVPSFTLYGNGRVLVATFADAAAKGQAGLNGLPQQVLRETALTEDQVQALLRYALVDGQLGIAKTDFPVLVMDIPTTVIELHAGGIDKVVRAAGLSLDPQPGPDAAVLKSLASLVEKLGTIPTTADYAATASVAILAETQPDPTVPALDWPWPGLAPAAFAQPAPNDPFGSTRHQLTDAEASAIGIANGDAAPPAHYTGPDGKTYVVVVRPALPDEVAAG
jgi:hypothetical protein